MEIMEVKMKKLIIILIVVMFCSGYGGRRINRAGQYWRRHDISVRRANYHRRRMYHYNDRAAHWARVARDSERR